MQICGHWGTSSSTYRIALSSRFACWPLCSRLTLSRQPRIITHVFWVIVLFLNVLFIKDFHTGSPRGPSMPSGPGGPALPWAMVEKKTSSQCRCTVTSDIEVNGTLCWLTSFPDGPSRPGEPCFPSSPYNKWHHLFSFVFMEHLSGEILKVPMGMNFKRTWLTFDPGDPDSPLWPLKPWKRSKVKVKEYVKK